MPDASTLSACPTLLVDKLQKEYLTPLGPLAVLRDVTLRMNASDALAVTGPSGSGKSSLLFVLGAMEQPTSGDVQILGQPVPWSSEIQLAELRREKIGFVFQEHHLLPQCTVLENVLIPLLAGPGVQSKDVEQAQELLRRVGLEARLDHRPAQLSGGERQRVAVCRALINRPVLILADEPTGSLDRANADTIGNLLLELSRDAGAALICVTHSSELAARFSRRAELRDGTLVESH